MGLFTQPTSRDGSLAPNVSIDSENPFPSTSDAPSDQVGGLEEGRLTRRADPGSDVRGPCPARARAEKHGSRLEISGFPLP